MKTASISALLCCLVTLLTVGPADATPAHASILPRAGHYVGNTNVEFYVTPDRHHVVRLSYTTTYTSNLPVQTCSAIGSVNQTSAVLINGKASFSAKIPFAFNGTFSSETNAHGGVSADGVSAGTCGTVGGTGNTWKATWKDSSQPTGKVLANSFSSTLTMKPTTTLPSLSPSVPPSLPSGPPTLHR